MGELHLNKVVKKGHVSIWFLSLNSACLLDGKLDGRRHALSFLTCGTAELLSHDRQQSLRRKGHRNTQ